MDEFFFFSFFFFSGTAAQDTRTCGGARFAQDRLEYFVFFLSKLYLWMTGLQRERGREGERGLSLAYQQILYLGRFEVCDANICGVHIICIIFNFYCYYDCHC